VPLDDVTRVPFSSAKMQERYKDFLTKPLPRAFAVSEGGSWYYAWSTNPRNRSDPIDPSARALVGCERNNRGPCHLYAVDNEVVYTPK
jgi:hypothetical protein